MKRVTMILTAMMVMVTLITPAEDALSEVPKRVNFADLIQKDSGPGTHCLYEKGHEDTPFTGIAVREFPDGRKSETHFKAGKGNGLSTLWFANGKKAMEVTLVDDKPHGVMTVWDMQGNVLSRKTFEDGKEVAVAKD